MKIAHVITRLLRAGSEENTLATCAGQLEMGHDVTIFHGPNVNVSFARRKAPGVNFVEVPALQRELSIRDDIAAVRQLRALFRDMRPDVVHTHQSKAGIVGRIAAALVRTPLVIHGVHILPFLAETGAKRAFYLAAEKMTGPITHAYVHVSEEMESACRRNNIGRKSLHRVVHSGFDIAQFADAAPSDDWREIMGLGDDAPKPRVVGMLASLEERKRHLQFIRHIPALLAKAPDTQFLFAGEGHLKDELNAEITALGLKKNVHLIGYRDDPERILALADVCVLCSMREGLPRSVMQYLAAGHPSFVLHTDGIERLVKQDQNGMIFATDDWDGLIGALTSVLQDDPRRAVMAQHAKNTDLSSWDVSLMAQRTLNVYDEIVAERSDFKPRIA